MIHIYSVLNVLYDCGFLFIVLLSLYRLTITKGSATDIVHNLMCIQSLYCLVLYVRIVG